jgi:nucleotide-binding universal stress UspA family protein
MKTNDSVTIAKGETAENTFRINNILVPTDFSDASHLALEHARGFAALFGSNLHLLNVVPPLLPPSAANEPSRMVQDAEQQMSRFITEAKVIFSHERVHVRYGELLEELNSYIQDGQIDLVVIGSSARAGANRLLLGSMAEYIFRGLEAPVLAVGPNATHPISAAHGIRHIVMCESLVPDATPAMDYGCALAEISDAAVTVLHTLPESLKDSPRALQFQRMFEEELRMGATHPERFARADYIVTFGDTSREAVRAAKSVKADLIVLGAKPAEMWQTHLGRGTAYRIVANAACPVLSVRSAL